MSVQKFRSLFGNKKPQAGESAIPAVVPLTLVLDLYEPGVLKHYGKNRGTLPGEALRLNKALVGLMQDKGIRSVDFGTIVLSDEENGTYKFADGNSRVYAASLYRKNNPGVDLSKITAIVEVCNKADHLKAYKHANGGKRHTGRDKVTNTDYVAGRTINSILNDFSLELDEGLWQSFFYILFAANTLDKKDRLGELNMEEIRATQSKADRLRDLSPSENLGKSRFVVSAELQEKLAAGISHFHAIGLAADKLLDQAAASKTTCNVMKKTGVFMSIMIDSLSGSDRFTRIKPADFVKKFQRLGLEGVELMSEISRRNKATQAMLTLRSKFGV